MTRRDILLAGLVGILLRVPRAAAAPALFDEVFEAVWIAVRDQFYDPNTRGVDWLEIKKEFAPRVSRCTSRQQLLNVLRDMLRRLHNSHIFLYSREEWDLRQNILPFSFERLGKRVFIRELLQLKIADDTAQYKYGDEILSIDQTPLDNLQAISLATLQNVEGNLNFGPGASVAELNIRRNGKTFIVKARRVTRPLGFQNVVISKPEPGISVLRMLTLNSAELPEERLRDLWTSLQTSRGLIIDLRSCVGGDSKVSNFIAGGLLGERKPLFTEVPRPGSGQPNVEYSDAGLPRFRGRVAILTNSNTESEPEVLAAVCKEYGCARLIGQHTAGALNGWTTAIPLPDHFARFALPYTRGVSPKGRSYEGHGIAPDEMVHNSVEDYQHGRDRVLNRAIEEVQ
jgi:C-terminal processing protease CtpA/Prc